jgi:hypothetical protein
MRALTNTISPMILFWYVVYALALFVFFVGKIVVGNESSNRAPMVN